MRAVNMIRRNPVTAVCVVLTGVIVWLVAGFVLSLPTVGGPAAGVPPRMLPLPTEGPVPVVMEAPLPPEEERARSIALLPKIRPGMTRVEVEGILGPPAADAIHPVTVTGDQARYRAAYDLADPEPPATVRPIRPFRLPSHFREAPAPGVRVALEYDATKPGHPLIEVFYLDPLF